MSPPELPSPEDIEEMEEGERERIEEILEAITLAGNAEQIHKEIEELNRLALKAKTVEDAETEAKLFRLKELLHKEGEIQILVATEAAGEGINLQCCNVLFNYALEPKSP